MDGTYWLITMKYRSKSITLVEPGNVEYQDAVTKARDKIIGLDAGNVNGNSIPCLMGVTKVQVTLEE